MVRVHPGPPIFEFIPSLLGELAAVGMGKAAPRGFIWTLEYALTFCLVGALGWLWMLWDPQKQAINDKVAGTIVTTS
jgi:hypothetical protein